MKLCFVLTNTNHKTTYKVGDFIAMNVGGVTMHVWRQKFYTEAQIPEFNADAKTLARQYAKKFYTAMPFAVADAAPEVAPPLEPVIPQDQDKKPSEGDGGDGSPGIPEAGNTAAGTEDSAGGALVDAPAPHESTPSPSDSIPTATLTPPVIDTPVAAPVKARGTLSAPKPAAKKAGRPKKTDAAKA